MLKHWFSFLILFMTAFACTDNKAAKEVVRSKNVVNKPAYVCNYPQQKEKCRLLYEEYQQSGNAVLKDSLTSFITDSLLPCWYGTPWDFNGTTETPGQGKIACGYFVTTVLRDAGMKINRVKMAQCASEQLVKTTCTDLKRYSNKPIGDFVNDILSKGYGLYIVGLDNHTGFIFNDGKEVWFIHSGVYPPACALKEKAISSVTLINSGYRVVGKVVF